MLEQLIGCRLESVKLGKFSWALEFEGIGAQPARYLLTSAAAVSCVGAGQTKRPIYDLIHEMLEDELMAAHHDGDGRVVTLRFKSGAQLLFSNRGNEGGDNAAIVTNIANGEWESLS